MLKIFSILLVASISVLSADDAESPNIKNGQELFMEQDCLKCHTTDKLKPRENKMSSFDKLHKKVEQCAYGLNTGWFEEEIIDVSHYLNANYYHFKVKNK